MQYRKPNFLIFLTLVGLGVAICGPANAETRDRIGGYTFKGPTATCLPHANLIYPCVSLSPPTYHPNPGTGIVSPTIAPELPLDAGQRSSSSSSWIQRFKKGEYWSSDWKLSHGVRDMDLTLERSGASMKMDIGPLKFNVFSEDGDLSESRFFLGIDRRW